MVLLIIIFPSTFVPNKDIHDNILVAHESLSSFSRKRNKKGYTSIKLDTEKAYEHLDCDSIRNCFTDLGYYNRWTNWIMKYIFTIMKLL